MEALSRGKSPFDETKPRFRWSFFKKLKCLFNRTDEKKRIRVTWMALSFFLLLLASIASAQSKHRGSVAYPADAGPIVTTHDDKGNVPNLLFEDPHNALFFSASIPGSDTMRNISGYKILGFTSASDSSQLELDHVILDSAHIENSFDQVTIYNSIIKGNTFFDNDGSTIHTLAVDNCKLKRDVYFYTDLLNEMLITNTQIGGKALLCDLKIDKNSIITGTIKGALDLSGLQIYNNATLDLTYLKHDSVFNGTRIPIILTGATVGNIDLNYKYFQLTFNPKTDPGLQEKTYEDLLYSFKLKKKMDDYQLLAKDYRHMTGDSTMVGKITNWVIDRREDYGTRLGFMLGFTCLVFLIFSIINIHLYKHLSEDVYKVDNFDPHEISKTIPAWLCPFYCSVIYTSIIFINPFLKLENLYYKKIFSLLYVLFLYSFGLFLLYYIVHYLLRWD